MNLKINNEIFEYDKMQKTDTDFVLYKDNNEVLRLSDVNWDNLNYEIVKETLDDYKVSKQAEIDSIYDNLIKAGYHDSELDITLAIKKEDRNQFTSDLTFFKLLPESELPATVEIKDIDKKMHEISMTDYFALLSRMGYYYKSIWSKKSHLDNQIEDATTIEQVDALVW